MSCRKTIQNVTIHNRKNICIDMFYLFQYLLGYITCKFHPARYTRNKTENPHRFLYIFITAGLTSVPLLQDNSRYIKSRTIFTLGPYFFSIVWLHIHEHQCDCAFVFLTVACHHAHTKVFLTNFDTGACGWLTSIILSHNANCACAVPRAK